MPAEIKLAIMGENDIVVARQSARDFSKALGFGVVDQTRITTAVSELTRNVVRYATDSRGEIWIHEQRSADRRGIEIVVSDSGPGIADIDKVLAPGFTSGRGLGLGLPGTRRLMDEMEIKSSPGSGTTVTIRKWCL